MGNIRIVNRKRASEVLSGNVNKDDCSGNSIVTFKIVSTAATEVVKYSAVIDTEGNAGGDVKITDNNGVVLLSRGSSSNGNITIPTNVPITVELNTRANTVHQGIHGTRVLLADCSNSPGRITVSGTTSLLLESDTLGYILEVVNVQTLYADDPDSGGGGGLP